MRILSPLILTALPLIVLGCEPGPAPSTSKLVKLDIDSKRDTDRARALNQQAVVLIAKSDLGAAEQVLKEAVTADAEFGPAQNNLGVVYFKQSKLYQAAQQFLLAAALMPRDAEPRNGLGLTFESSNRFDYAITYFDRARTLDPSNIEYLGNSARAHVRRGDQSDELRAMLAHIAADDSRIEWSQWASQTLHRMNRPSAGAMPTSAPSGPQSP